MASFPTLVRNIPVYQIVPDEAVELIHEASLGILEDVGCEFRDSEAIAAWKAALDEGVAEGLRDFVARREGQLPDSVN